MADTTVEALAGQKIELVRRMTDGEMEREIWAGFAPTALQLENGVVLFPSRDPEGNGPGALFSTGSQVFNGKTIKDVRPMTDAEMDREGWAGDRPTAIELLDGTVLYPSEDPEGNGPGVFFGYDSENDKSFTLLTYGGG
jgi:hypothetical protein